VNDLLALALIQRIAARIVNPVCVFFMLCVNTLPVGAIDYMEIQVTNNGGVYHMKIVAEVDASAEYVHRVLTDYRHIYRLNPLITESEVLSSPGNGAVRVRTRIENCTLIYCVDIERVEDVYDLSSYELHMVIVPSLSDFLSGNAKWEIGDKEEYSEIVYQAQIEPAFSTFPIVGSAIAKRRLRQEMTILMARIECIAKVLEEQDWNSLLQVDRSSVDPACLENVVPVPTNASHE
jgi:hypothetical protein